MGRILQKGMVTMKSFVCALVVFVCAIIMVGSESWFAASYLTVMGVCGFVAMCSALVGVLVAEEY